MKKICLYIAAGLFSSLTMASMPQAPNSPNGYDEFRAADGTACRTSVGGNVQVYGGAYDTDIDGGNYYGNVEEKGFHVGIAYSFGGTKRIDCSRLQEIETQRAELELQKLKDEIEMLKKMRQMQLLKTGNELPSLD